MHPRWLLAAALVPAPAWADTFVVTSNADDGPGTLREAIELVNDDSGPHTISFDLGGPATIEVLSALPEITEPVTIDGLAFGGSCSPRGTPHDLQVTLRAAYGTDDALLDVRSDGFTLRGIALVGFQDEGVLLLGAADGARLQCNYFGVRADGSTPDAGGGSDAIVLEDDGDDLPSDVVIGTDGDGLADDTEWNLFATSELGVSLTGPNPDTDPRDGGTGIVIAGNLFGLLADGSAPPEDPSGEVPLGIGVDVVRVFGPYAGVQIGQPCDGTGTAAQGNVFGWFGSDAIDIQDPYRGADDICVAGNDIHLTAAGLSVGDALADVGVEFDGAHTGLQVVDNRFARLNTGIRVRSQNGLAPGEAPTGVRIADNRFGDAAQSSLGVRRAMELREVPGAVIEFNQVYGGPDAPNPSIGSGVALFGAQATLQDNLFAGLLGTGAVLLAPWEGNVDVRDEALTPDDVLSVATLANNTFDGCDQPILADDVPVDPKANDQGATLLANNTIAGSPTGIGVVQRWRLQAEMATEPTTPMALHLLGDPVLDHAMDALEPYLLAEQDALDQDNPVPDGWFLGTLPEDTLRNVRTWPLVVDYVRTVDNTVHTATWTEGCGTPFPVDGLPGTDPTHTGIGLQESLPIDWAATNAAFGTSLSTADERYHAAELVGCACGNGFLDPTEACDDGNIVPGDGCTACQIDSGFVCAQLPLQATALDAFGARLPHDTQDPSWFYDDGSLEAAAWVIDIGVCPAPLGWSRVALGPAQAGWLTTGTNFNCSDVFPDNVPVTFSQSITVDDALRGPSIASVWVATDDDMTALSIDGVNTEYAGDVVYSRFVQASFPTRTLQNGSAALGFTVLDTGGDGGFLALPGPSACAPDTDGDGLGDSGDDDSDGDGVPDVEEGLYGFDPTNDHDLDGVLDADDPDAPGFADSDGNGVDDRLDVDGDGLPDHRDDDSDDDGLPDGEEVVQGTDPRNPDSDGGGVPDGEEVLRGSNPLDASDDSPDTGPTDTGMGDTDTDTDTDTDSDTDTDTDADADADADTDVDTVDSGTPATGDGPPAKAPLAAQGCRCNQGGAPSALLLPAALLWLRRRSR